MFHSSTSAESEESLDGFSEPDLRTSYSSRLPASHEILFKWIELSKFISTLLPIHIRKCTDRAMTLLIHGRTRPLASAGSYLYLAPCSSSNYFSGSHLVSKWFVVKPGSASLPGTPITPSLENVAPYQGGPWAKSTYPLHSFSERLSAKSSLTLFR